MVQLARVTGVSAGVPAPRFRTRRKVGVATTDFALFADVVQTLKEAKIQFVDFDPADRVPGNVGVVITSASEAQAHWVPDDRPVIANDPAPDAAVNQPRWKGCRVLALHWKGLSGERRDREMTLLPFRVVWAQAGYPLLRVGLDPGPRPGIAILGAVSGSMFLLVDYQAADEEQALTYLLGVLMATGPGMMVIRVGHGAPLPRNRLANGVLRAATSMWGPGPDNGPPPATAAGHEARKAPAVAVEIVDETGSSSGTRKGSNVVAAARIATIPGYRLRKPLRSHIKPTDIAKVQERSRRKTGGRRSLSALLAEAVAAGQLGLDEALEREE